MNKPGLSSQLPRRTPDCGADPTVVILRRREAALKDAIKGI